MKFDAPVENESNDRWLNSFANLMMLLFALFVVLYATAKLDAKKLAEEVKILREAVQTKPKAVSDASPPPAGSGAPDAGAEDLQARLLSEVNAVFQAANPEARGPQTWVEFEALNADSFLIRLFPPGLFRPGEARVEDRLRPLLDRLGVMIRKSSRRLKIEGHADYEDSELLGRQGSLSSVKNTWELSALRAAWLAQYWMRKFDFDPAKMEVMAFGKYRPLSGRAGEAANNRRLEIVIEKKDVDSQDDGK